MTVTSQRRYLQVLLHKNCPTMELPPWRPGATRQQAFQDSTLNDEHRITTPWGPQRKSFSKLSMETTPSLHVMRTASLGDKIQHGCLICAEFHHISQFHGVWTWDMKHFSDQAAKGYEGFWYVKSVSKQAAYYMEWRGPHVMSCLIGSWFHVPKAHISLRFLIRNMRHVPNSNTIALGNEVKISTFIIAWSRICAVWKLHTNIFRQLTEDGLLWPKQIRQPCFLT